MFGNIIDSIMELNHGASYAKGGEISKDKYENYLNEVGEIYDIESDEWVIGGKNRYRSSKGKYGAAIRKHDPIAFNTGYGEWNPDEMAAGGMAGKSLTVGTKVKVLKSPNKGIKGEVLNIDNDTFSKISVKTDRGHILYGFEEADLKRI